MSSIALVAFVAGRRWFSTLGHRADRRGADAARGRPRARADDVRHPRPHHRRAAVRGLAVARAARLRARRLVQLRRDGHEGPERRHDPARSPGPGGRRHRADRPERRVRGQGARAGAGARAARRQRDRRPAPRPGADRRRVDPGPRGLGPVHAGVDAAGVRRLVGDRPAAARWRADTADRACSGRVRLDEPRHARVRPDARVRRVPDDPPPDARHRRASAAVRGRSAGPRGPQAALASTPASPVATPIADDTGRRPSRPPRPRADREPRRPRRPVDWTTKAHRPTWCRCSRPARVPRRRTGMPRISRRRRPRPDSRMGAIRPPRRADRVPFGPR